MNSSHSALVTGTRPIRNAGDVDGVGRPLVVQRARLVGGVDAEHERAGRDEHGVAAATGRPGGSGAPAPSSGAPVAQLVGGQHRLDVLLLVLLDHHEREQLPGPPSPAPLEPVEDPTADVGDELARLRRGQQRQVDPGRRADAGTRRRALDRRAGSSPCAGRRRRRAAARGPPAGRCARGPRPAGSSAGSAGGSARARRGRSAAGCARGRPPAARRSRSSVSAQATCFLLQHGERPDRRDPAAQLVARAGPRVDELGVRLDLRPQLRWARAQATATHPDGPAEAAIVEPVAGGGVPASATLARVGGGVRRDRVVEQGDGDARRAPATTVGHRVEAAHLEVAARPHGREQRGQVVVEVGGRGRPGEGPAAAAAQPLAKGIRR